MLGKGAVDLDIQTLEAVAKARFGLMICADYLYKMFITDECDRRVIGVAGSLFDAAEHLCDRVGLKWPR